MIRACIGFAAGAAAAIVVLYVTGAIAIGDSLLLLMALAVGLLAVTACCVADVREQSAERHERQRP